MKKILLIVLSIITIFAFLSLNKKIYYNTINGKTYFSTMSERSQNNYNSLKNSVESNYNNNGFDIDIDKFTDNLGPAINFGNELDFPSKNRKYTLRLSVGYNENEYFYYEIPFNGAGNIFNKSNRSDSSKEYAKINLTEVEGLNLTTDSPINYIKISVSNPFEEAHKQDLTVNMSYLNLVDNSGNYLVTNAGNIGEYTIRLNDANPVTFFNKSLNTTYGKIKGEETYLRLATQLEDYVSDYKNNATDVYTFTYNGEVATDSELEFLKNEGIKGIRLPITWYSHMDSTGTVDPDWFVEVKKVIDRIISHGFYVMVNIHHDAGSNGWIKADATSFSEYEYAYRYLILQIADNLKDYDEHLIFESPNEVLNYKNVWNDNEWHTVSASDIEIHNKINQIFVDEIRRTGHNNTNRFIVLNTYGDQEDRIKDFILPTDSANDKLYVEIHCYTYNDDALLDSSVYLLSDEGKEYLDKYHFILGEFGIHRTKDLDLRKNFVKNNAEIMAKLRIPIFYWDDGGNYALMRLKHAEWDLNYNSDEVAKLMISAYKRNYVNYSESNNSGETITSNEENNSVIVNPKTGVLDIFMLIVPGSILLFIYYLILKNNRFITKL